MIYLDHNATTNPSFAAEAGVHMGLEYWGNPNSVHRLGTEPAKLIKQAEEIVLDHINGHNGRIIWTGGGSDANRLAIQATCRAPGDLVTSYVEHKSVEEMRKRYCDQAVYVDRYGRPDVTKFCGSHFSSRTKLLSLILVNNETGAVTDSWKLAHIIKGQPEILLHFDAVQGLGKLDLDVQALGCSFLTLSAHKIYGPKGIGCLWVRDDVKAAIPTGHTPNTPGILGFAGAVNQLRVNEYRQELLQKEEIFLEELRSEDVEFEINFNSQHRMPGTLSLHFPGVDGAELAFMLSDAYVLVSTGSACNAKQEDHRVLKMSGLEMQVAKETVRISLGKTCSHVELIDGAQIIADIVEELRNG